jgi:hypothetical protein
LNHMPAIPLGVHREKRSEVGIGWCGQTDAQVDGGNTGRDYKRKGDRDEMPKLSC